MQGLREKSMARAGSREHGPAKGVRAPRRSGEADRVTEAGSNSYGQVTCHDGRGMVLNWA